MASRDRGGAAISILGKTSSVSEHGPAATGKLLSGRQAGPGPLLSLNRQRTQCVLA